MAHRWREPGYDGLDYHFKKLEEGET